MRIVSTRKTPKGTPSKGDLRMRAIVATMAHGVVLQDAEGRFVTCNAAAERILGLSAAQLSGRLPIDAGWQALREDGTPFGGDDHPAMVTARTGAPLSGVLMGIPGGDGATRWIAISSEPVRPERGASGFSAPLAVVSTFADVTERKHREDALRAAVAENERLVAELREALSRAKALSGILPMCMYCKKIRDDEGAWEQFEHYISDRSDAIFSHGLCPACDVKHYGFDDDAVGGGGEPEERSPGVTASA